MIRPFEKDKKPQKRLLEPGEDTVLYYDYDLFCQDIKYFVENNAAIKKDIPEIFIVDNYNVKHKIKCNKTCEEYKLDYCEDNVKIIEEKIRNNMQGREI